jgi:lysophospholipase L1-like esterase
MGMPFVLALIAIIGLLLIVGIAQRRSKVWRNVSINLMITYVVAVLLLAGGELYFRYGYADSRMEFALTKDNWSNRYMQKNSLGYRDREWPMETLEQREVVFAVGDSFTQGWGINDPADRFTDVLASELGDDYAVVNLGIAGRSTINELAAMEDYPYQPPDVILWQYFINDIDIAAKSNGTPWEPNVPPVPQIAQESYLASYLFWRLNESSLYVNANDNLSEWDYYYAAYDNNVIWEIHQTEIDQIIAYANENDSRLIVVIFPNMRDPVRSVAYVDRVEQYMDSKGVTDILKLYDAAAAWNIEDRIVSNVDSHASAAFSRYVGELIYDEFFANSATTAAVNASDE